MNLSNSAQQIGRQEAVIRFIRKKMPILGEELFLIRERLRYKKKFGHQQKKFWINCFAPGDPFVLSGPFQGMKYLRGTVMGPPLPRWLGTYEQELHVVLSEEVFPSNYEKIVIVGSAEGYYSCGLARHFPAIPIYSFETTWLCRMQQKKLLSKNKITNVKVRGHLDILQFRKMHEGCRALCLLDIEGYELEFCNAESSKSLLQVDLLIEIHAFGRHTAVEVQEQIKKALANSHQIKILEPEKRDLLRIQANLPRPIDLSELSEAVREYRGFPQKWIWAKARANA